MAVRKMSLKDWTKACFKNSFDDGLLEFIGPTPIAAAQTLEVSKQRIHQMIEDKTLDAVRITAPNGTITVTYVTQASLDRYLAKRAPAIHGGYTLLPTQKA
jgi:hypothetical protein